MARHLLELDKLGVLRLLELFLELPDVLFAVGKTLVAARELLELLLDLDLFRQNTLLDLQHLRAPVGELRVDFRAQPHHLLAGLDLPFAPHGVALPARVDSSGWSRILQGLGNSGRPPKTDTASRARAAPTAIPMAIPIPICTCRLLGRGTLPLFGGTSHPAPDLRGGCPEKPFSGRRRPAREFAALFVARPPSHWV